MCFISITAACLVLAYSALAAPVETKLSSFGVTLSQVGNTRVKAVVKNAGNEDVTFMHLGFFGDSAPVKKVSVYRNGTELDFLGIMGRYQLSNITPNAITSLPAGATMEDEFDIASTSKIFEGGIVTVRAEGLVPLVAENKVSGYIQFSSNTISMDVNAAEASTVARAIKRLHRRVTLDSCNDNQRSIVAEAMKNAASLADKAAEAAMTGSSPQFEALFKASSTHVRSTVAARLRAVASEASSTSSGALTYYCNDPYNFCNAMLAYTLPGQNVIANCDIFYTYPALDDTCFNQDQATTVIHELTHAPAVYSPGTADFAGGYPDATKLNTNQALNNADTYALFANAVRLGC